MLAFITTVTLGAEATPETQGTANLENSQPFCDPQIEITCALYWVTGKARHGARLVTGKSPALTNCDRKTPSFVVQ
jgi:hypothetical protein